MSANQIINHLSYRLLSSGAGFFNIPKLLSNSDALSNSARSSASGFGHLLPLSASTLENDSRLAKNESDLATRDCTEDVEAEAIVGFS